MSACPPMLHIEWPGGTNSVPLDRPTLTLGRDPDTDIVIDFPTVSGRHARLARQDRDGYLLTDLGSRNGFMVNGRRVRSVRLDEHSEVRIGDGEGTSVTLRYDSGRRDAGEKTSLKSTPIGRGVQIGRGEDCDIVLPHPTVSHHHAEVILRGNRHMVVDLGSLNGTYVNGAAVRGHALHAGET